MWPILFHVGQHVPNRLFCLSRGSLGLSWGSLGSLGAFLGLSWALLGPSWGRKTAQSRPKAGIPPKSLKSSPLPHGRFIFVPSWGSLWSLVGLSWSLWELSWALLRLEATQSQAKSNHLPWSTCVCARFFHCRLLYGR